MTTVQLVIILKNFLSVGHVEDRQVCLFVFCFALLFLFIYLKIIQQSLQK